MGEIGGKYVQEGNIVPYKQIILGERTIRVPSFFNANQQVDDKDKYAEKLKRKGGFVLHTKTDTSYFFQEIHEGEKKTEFHTRLLWSRKSLRQMRSPYETYLLIERSSETRQRDLLPK